MGKTQRGGALTILPVIDSGSGSSLSSYVVEMLAAEGFSWERLVDLRKEALTPKNLADTVPVIAAVTLSQYAQHTVMNYLYEGGGVLFLRPPKEIARALGLVPACERLTYEGRERTRLTDLLQRLTTDAYLQFNPEHRLYSPKVPPRLQYCGEADAYHPNDGDVLATLYWGGEINPYPAIVTGTHGEGAYGLFTYDPAKSTVLFHQGRPEQSSLGSKPGLLQERLYAPNDLFIGHLNPELRRVPQADIQQRILSQMIEGLVERRHPVPRFWYFPDKAPAVAFLNGDSDGMNVHELAGYIDVVEAAGGSFTTYLLEEHRKAVTPAQEKAWRRRGHSFGPHIWCGLTPTPEEMAGRIADETREFREIYGYQPFTTRHHYVIWPGWAETAQALAANGFALETNFRAAEYYREGYLTGSGLPMRFMTEDGSLIDLYQQETLLCDDYLYQNKSYLTPLTSAEVIELALDMIDESRDAYHTVLHYYFHPVYDRRDPPLVFGTYTRPWLEAVTKKCKDEGIPMVSGDGWVGFIRAREQAEMSHLAWSDEKNTLRWRVGGAGEGARLTCMVPATFAGHRFQEVRVEGEVAEGTLLDVQGKEYVLVRVGDGPVEVRYLEL